MRIQYNKSGPFFELLFLLKRLHFILFGKRYRKKIAFLFLFRSKRTICSGVLCFLCGLTDILRYDGCFAVKIQHELCTFILLIRSAAYNPVVKSLLQSPICNSPVPVRNVMRKIDEVIVFFTCRKLTPQKSLSSTVSESFSPHKAVNLSHRSFNSS